MDARPACRGLRSRVSSSRWTQVFFSHASLRHSWNRGHLSEPLHVSSAPRTAPVSARGRNQASAQAPQSLRLRRRSIARASDDDQSADLWSSGASPVHPKRCLHSRPHVRALQLCCPTPPPTRFGPPTPTTSPQLGGLPTGSISQANPTPTVIPGAPASPGRVIP
jgi:hypothetical protein